MITKTIYQQGLKYNKLPKKVSRKEFNRYIAPYLKNRLKALNQRFPFTRFSTIFSMFYTQVFSGNSLKLEITNPTGLISINGITTGPKIAPMKISSSIPS